MVVMPFVQVLQLGKHLSVYSSSDSWTPCPTLSKSIFELGMLFPANSSRHHVSDRWLNKIQPLTPALSWFYQTFDTMPINHLWVVFAKIKVLWNHGANFKGMHRFCGTISPMWVHRSSALVLNTGRLAHKDGLLQIYMGRPPTTSRTIRSNG